MRSFASDMCEMNRVGQQNSYIVRLPFVRCLFFVDHELSDLMECVRMVSHRKSTNNTTDFIARVRCVSSHLKWCLSCLQGLVGKQTDIKQIVSFNLRDLRGDWRRGTARLTICAYAQLSKACTRYAQTNVIDILAHLIQVHMNECKLCMITFK